MDWKAKLEQATAAIKGEADSEKLKTLTAKAKQAASDLAEAAKKGTAHAAAAVSRATSDPTTLRLSYLGAEISVVSPSDGLQVTRAHTGALVVADGDGNALVISLTEPGPQVAESVGVVNKLDDTTYDLGAEDGHNVVVLKG